MSVVSVASTTPAVSSGAPPVSASSVGGSVSASSAPVPPPEGSFPAPSFSVFSFSASSAESVVVNEEDGAPSASGLTGG